MSKIDEILKISYPVTISDFPEERAVDVDDIKKLFGEEE